MNGRHWKACAVLALLLALVCAAACAQETHAVEVGTWEELAQAIQNAQKGTVITLTEDITSEGDDAFRNTKNAEIVIDLGGHLLRQAAFTEGTFSIRNGRLVALRASGEGKGVSVSLAEDVTCESQDASVPNAVSLLAAFGKVSFANAGQIEGIYGVALVHSGSQSVKLTNTGTIVAEAYALEMAASDSQGSIAVVNDGHMESRCCAAVAFVNENTISKKIAPLTITGTGELVGACGVYACGKNITIDQRITAVYTAEKTSAVLEQEKEKRKSALETYELWGIGGEFLKDENLEYVSSLRHENTNGVAVAVELLPGTDFKLSVSGTLSATNKLLLAPNILPYTQKSKLTLKASVAPDSQADFFDVFLPIDTAMKTFDEAAVQKKLKTGMARLDVDEFLANGGRLRVCVSAPRTNAEGKLLVSVARDALADQHLGGYLTADGMQWDAAVSQKIYDTYSPAPLTEDADRADSFTNAVRAKKQYAVYLDCDVSDCGESFMAAYRDAEKGRLYVEGDGRTLEGFHVYAKAFTVRGITLNQVTLSAMEMALENCRCEHVVISEFEGKKGTKAVVRDCDLVEINLNNKKQLAVENCQYETLRISDVDNAVLSGVSAKQDSENSHLVVFDSKVKMNESCTASTININAYQSDVSFTNDGNADTLWLRTTQGRKAKLSGTGRVNCIRLETEEDSALTIQQDAQTLMMYVNDWKGSLSYKGNLERAELFAFSSEPSISLAGKVGSIVVYLPTSLLTFDESKEDSPESYFIRILQNLKLEKCEPLEGDAVRVFVADDQTHLTVCEFAYQDGKLVPTNP